MTKNIDPATRLRSHYDFVRGRSLALCAPLRAEDYVVQPHPDVSPPKWHLGHTTWFFENFVLAPHAPGYEAFDERLNWFFNSYYESQGPRIQRSSRGNMTRPELAVVLAYRHHVDAALRELLDGPRAAPPEVHRLVELGLHHEQQHQELLVTDIKYILGTNPFYPAYLPDPVATRSAGMVDPAPTRSAGTLNPAPAYAPAATPGHHFRRVAGGLHPIGHAGEGFAWDNEGGAHRVFLEDFSIADRLVTNGDYLAFLEDGGYDRFELWQMEGIEWARQLPVKAPLFWNQDAAGRWLHYQLRGGLRPVDPLAPVTHVSWYEADAYARWAGARLATEFEWEVAARRYAPAVTEAQNWVEAENFQPTASARDGQFLGHVWEWTNSAYLPYPRYARPEGALGEYNGKFMINQMVLRGGSCATPRSHMRPTYRNFFQPDKRWQFTGIRLARDC